MGAEGGGSLRALAEARSLLEGVKDGQGKKAGEEKDVIEGGCTERDSFSWMEGILALKMDEKSIYLSGLKM